MRKITGFGRVYGKIAAPWLTALVYLWMLELIAVFSAADPEPLFDRIADCSAILATLGFWMSLAALLPSLLSRIIADEKIIALNRGAAKAALILITALYFLRWLFTWIGSKEGADWIFYIVLGLCLLLAGLSWRLRHNRQSLEFSLDDGWRYFTRPILMATVLVLAAKTGSSLWLEFINRRSLAHPHGTPPNVVLIVADALRAQNMSLYGYMRKTTPFLYRLAFESSVYTQMHANSTSTRPSLTTLLSGRYPFSHGRMSKFLPVYDRPENLLAELIAHGYTTAAIASNADATAYDLGLVRYLVYGGYPNFRRLTLAFLRDNGVYPTSLGIRMYDEWAQWFSLGYPERTMGYGPASDTVELAIRTLARLPRPFFLFVHLHEPHDPYHAPAPFKNKYASGDKPADRAKISAYYYQRYPAELQSLVDEERNHYDESIEYLDSEIEKLVNALQQDQTSQNTLLVLTGDHGESFERGFLNHGEDLYESSLHVPLLIKFPGRTKGERLSIPAQSIDIAPTILKSVGIAPPDWMDGVSLAGAEGLENRETIAVNYKDPAQEKIYKLPTKAAIRWRGLKLIVSCDSGQAELYDLGKDPAERMNLVSSIPATAKEMWQKFEDRLGKGAAKMPCKFQPNA
jgi:arylsulfatase A-like enzyme